MMKIAMAAALIVVGTVSMTAGAKAETKVMPKAGSLVIVKSDRLAAPKGQAAAGENVAKEWTLACYREFGPDAKYPDEALLEKCLN
ncbi:hypothetical protein FE840_015255 [Peteryoungia desertarenae]|uniref:Uncharacterized protein n=1 Tax=Peteryoungia desertarenae TaxID=1813451 RepID=A0ABX6QQF2_9HYPH|nr:hypothetical protein [Peteryoungia desertarenae]QLF70788.1 hypothetical protein FE840_015255 [Peteryoungia desertarenae]